MRASYTQEHWFVTADSRRATLFHGMKDENNRLRVAEDRSVANMHEKEHERGRPSALGRGSGAGGAPSFASFGHTGEEEHKRFAREVCTWLKQAADQHQFPIVTVFAPPEFIGQLRHELNGLSSRVELRKAELTRLRPGALATHPAVLEEMDRQARLQRGR
ncbi:MAG: hypothetical protein DYG94_03395 [Leptolyngbya sp. PLA3]|nr:MAG: hypothetical protein EDM82_10905 [Cyanobacteria bacterium CYA]MCE7967776.1 hypothetical protein [Leptolyngbya sp. PL-A3]